MRAWTLFSASLCPQDPGYSLVQSRNLTGNHGASERRPHWTVKPGWGRTMFVKFACSKTFGGCSKNHYGFFGGKGSFLLLVFLSHPSQTLL